MGVKGKVTLYCLIHNDNNECYGANAPRGISMSKSGSFPASKYHINSAVMRFYVRRLYSGNKMVIRKNSRDGEVIATWQPIGGWDPGDTENVFGVTTDVSYWSNLSEIWWHGDNNYYCCQLKAGHNFEVVLEYETDKLEWPEGATCQVNPEASYDTATLTWTACPAEGRKGYKVQYKDDVGEHTEWTDCGTSTTESLTVNVPVALCKRSFRVMGLSDSGDSGNTDWLESSNTLIALYTDPELSTNITFDANPAPGNTTMRWTGNGGRNNPCASYQIRYRDKNTDGTYTAYSAIQTVTTESIAVSPPGEYVERYYQIKALGTVPGTESGWATSPALTLLISRPSTPGKPFFENTPAVSAQNLLWGASIPGYNNPVRHYQIQISTDGVNWTNAGTATTNRFWIDYPPDDVFWYFRVKAIGTISGLDSDWSESSDGLMNLDSLLKEDENGALLMWRVKRTIDLAFAREQPRLMHLLLYEGDQFSHVFVIRWRKEMEGITPEGDSFQAIFRHLDSGTEYNCPGKIKKGDVYIPFAARMTELTGDWEGFAYARKANGDNMLMDHIRFTVDKR